MEDDFETFNTIQKVDPITFGSIISINLDGRDDCFLTSEGFVDNHIYVKNFKSGLSSNNFSFSLFRIMPFSNIASFRNQKRLEPYLQDFTRQIRKLTTLSTPFFLHTLYLPYVPSYTTSLPLSLL